MENKAVKWLLALTAVALLINAAVNFRPYTLVVVAVPGGEGRQPQTESYRLNVYTGRVSAVYQDDEETKKFFPEQIKKLLPQE